MKIVINESLLPTCKNSKNTSKIVLKIVVSRFGGVGEVEVEIVESALETVGVL